MENSRDGSGQRFQLLYEEEFYKKLPEVFITGTQGMHHTMLGICGIVLFSVCLLFMKRKENAELKINFIILTILLERFLMDLPIHQIDGCSVMFCC